MKRREFIALIGGAAALSVSPLAARGQQPVMPVVGILSGVSIEACSDRIATFREALSEAGFSEGRNLAFEYRSANSHYDKLPALAADLVRRQVSIIVAVGGGSPGEFARAATTSIPIVFVAGSDPVETGLVASLNKPGGNATGVSLTNTALAPKRLELVRDLVPNVSRVAFLLSPTARGFEANVRALPEAARAIGAEYLILKATTESDIANAFSVVVKERASALVVSNDAILTGRRRQIIELAARHAVPAVYGAREFIADGGLMSYAANVRESYRQAAVYVARLLKGERPGELPVVQPTKFDLVINLKTAKALGLTVPNILLVSADEVIE